MNKKLKQLVICEENNDLGDIIIIYNDDTIKKTDYDGVNRIIKEMYASDLSSEEIDSMILFLTKDKFNRYIRKYKKLETPKTEYYLNPNIDYDDIDLGLSIDDMKDPKKIRKKLGLVRRIKIRALSIGVIGTVLIGGFTLGFIKSRSNDNSKGVIVKSESAKDKDETTNVTNYTKENDFNELLIMTSGSQNNFMSNMNMFLLVYNKLFSKEHRNNGIKPSLKWDEVISLKLGYNFYNSEQINNIFNGYKLDVAELITNYNSAINQLRKSFVLENYKSQVSLDKLMDTNENKRLFNDINFDFMDLKENNFNDKEKVNSFYEKIYNRIITHKNTQTSFILEPIILASNDLLENSDYKNDYKDSIDNYFNSYDHSNYISSYFRNICELNTNEVNNNIPLYKDYKKTKIKQLKTDNCYNVNSRDLTKLPEYKKVSSKVKVNDKEQSKTYKYTK
ncbi:MAG: hypothetical protein IJF92_04865 [Bacilli bacterium]|nr:hypothetical protein [Bacilli bacterium]